VAVKIFNDKEVDELILLDIDATARQSPPNFELIGEIVSEAFVPVAYGGGVRTIDDARAMLYLGVEKIVVSTAAVENPQLVRELADTFGSQSVVVCMNVKKTVFGNYFLVTHGAKKRTAHKPVEFAKHVESPGAGEIMVNSVDEDGMMAGYDIGLIRAVTDAVSVPTIACGGAGNLQHLSRAHFEAGVSAVAAGSLFVFHGRHRAVLISYSKPPVLAQAVS
jgi:cyclase